MSILLVGFAEDHFTDVQKEAIQGAAAGFELLYSRDQAEVKARLPEIEIAVGSFPRDLLLQAPKLRWFQQWGAGADWLLKHPELAEKDFTLTNVSGIHAVPISEHIFAFLLSFARSFPRAMRDQLSSSWSQREQQPAFELAGKTMLLLGTGAIGGRTAKLAQAFDMRVVGVRRNPDKGVAHIDEMVALSELIRVLPEADFVVLTLPLTRDTHHLIGEAELRALKPEAILVNIGRGGLVDEGALVRALQEGWIAGAGLDVFETEPLPSESPLWGLENVIITPHTSGDTPHYDERALQIFLENLRRYRAGEPLTHVVDKSLGY
jgi:phosphoglycerate dehydrogenase-like enzyme